MNYQEALKWGVSKLLVSTTPSLDAEVLLANLLNISRSQLLIDLKKELSPDKWLAYQELINKRSNSIPVAYLVGSKEFWGLEFKVTPDVLIPRPETEHLVERALQIIKENSPPQLKILELGTGTGCISISLANELRQKNIAFEITAIDFSESALEIAKENYHNLAMGLPITFLKSNWFQDLPVSKFDLILSNPPYVNPNLADLSPELVYEPEQALFSKEEGLADIYQIINQSPTYLAEGGHLLIEIGSEQTNILQNYLLINHPQAKISSIPDLSGRDRIIEIKFT